MLVTALSPVIGYDKAAAITHKANDDGTRLGQAALATGYISADDFDRIVNPARMVGDPAAAIAAIQAPDHVTTRGARQLPGTIRPGGSSRQSCGITPRAPR